MREMSTTEITPQNQTYLIPLLHTYNHYSITLSPPFAHCLRTFFLIFPVLVFGSSSTTSTSLGTMNLLMPGCSFANFTTSSPLKLFPLRTVMKAFGRSPQCESETATMPHSRMSGCVTMRDSTAREEMFSPPTLH